MKPQFATCALLTLALVGLLPQGAAAQNRFGDAPASPSSGGTGGRPAGQGGQAGQAGQGGQGGGLGALAGPGGIAGPQGGRPAAQSPQGTQGSQGSQGGAAVQGGSGVDLVRLETQERQDHGVRPTPNLHRGPMHGGTPTSIPGGQVVTTRGLVELVRQAGGAAGQSQGAGGSSRVLFFDVLGGPERLPGALAAVPAHQAGSFDDTVQREFGGFLQQVTQGRQDAVLVFYCASTQCWMSYNAALRATRLGYRQVLWYRGGLESWKAAGLPVQTAQAGPGGAGGGSGQGPAAPSR